MGLGSTVSIRLLWIFAWSRFASAAGVAASSRLTAQNINKSSVVIAGFANSADFAHQFHIAFSSLVTGACLFSAQPFNCAITHFASDSLEPWTPWTHVPHCQGCPPGTTVPLDHCKRTPDVVCIGQLVDHPRRACGQNPITRQECFDDVKYLKSSRVFVFRGSHDDVYTHGAVENTVGLLAQMITDPRRSIKFVTDQPFSHILPLKSTPYFNHSEAAGYDGPGECLRHVFASQPVEGKARKENWHLFDQGEFAEEGIGFEKKGYVYIPEMCTPQTPCRLLIRPDRCDFFSPDVFEFSNYAEANGIVLLIPCVGGWVNRIKFPHAYEVGSGALDVYGQLSLDYVQQSAPHMRAIGKMLRRVLGVSLDIEAEAEKTEKTEKTAASSQKRITKNNEPFDKINPDITELQWQTVERQLPPLKIDRSSVITAGCSNDADFASQFHVAFSSLVTGSCIFSGQPFHCAATRFPQDYMVPKTPSTAAGIHCAGCPGNGTLIYDHCKNHPHWVVLDTLAEYAETAADVDDPVVHLAGARVFAFEPTHDRCYQHPAVENVANFYRRYAKDSSQIRLVDDQPFPHTLPTNDTPYFNHSTAAGYDGPGECLRHVFGHMRPLKPAVSADLVNRFSVARAWHRVDVSEFVSDTGVGLGRFAWLFVPPACKEGSLCKLLMLTGLCDIPPLLPSDDAFARYAFVNDIVIFKPCHGGNIDRKRFPHNHENLRGMADVYGQLSEDYSTQKGLQMAPIGKMLKRLLGIEEAVFV
eukprot:TRINITY_DN11099_c0_g1_i2.p1 TRINITY_DN11099_c0_g1~~TRINITY_DN11099_c0_g1_i2.p1  ORF type:complete len:755 (-),score=103.78 TRINITY_DN11099_c0_g1_i2:308-2572(-)